MPTVQVDLRRELFVEKGTAISEAIHHGLIEGLEMTADDLFQVYRPHDSGELVFSPTFGGVERRDLLWLRITMVHMFSPETKQRMCQSIARRLEQVGVRHQDLLISVVEVGFEDWYAGGPIDE